MKHRIKVKKKNATAFSVHKLKSQGELSLLENSWNKDDSQNFGLIALYLALLLPRNISLVYKRCDHFHFWSVIYFDCMGSKCTVNLLEKLH